MPVAGVSISPKACDIPFKFWKQNLGIHVKNFQVKNAVVANKPQPVTSPEEHVNA